MAREMQETRAIIEFNLVFHHDKIMILMKLKPPEFKRMWWGQQTVSSKSTVTPGKKTSHDLAAKQ